QYNTYTGRGGSYQLLRQDLHLYDYPAGGLFTVRWVLSEMDRHPVSQTMVFILRLLMDIFLLSLLGLLCLRHRKQPVTGANSAH
ncbi:MAG TPA: hypothetical protein PLV45_11285, partial [bacterium]|nr:hypothetical protein [bacterium]